MLSSQKLGIYGQTIFASLCNEHGITSTEPSEDINGWDFYLEFPPHSLNLQGDDSHRSNPQCKVQVKSTYKLNGNRAIHLSTLKTLAVDSLPAFIVFLEFSKNNKLISMYITHLGKSIVYRILKRVRQKEIKGKNLSKVEFTISIKERTKLVEPDAYFLRAYLLSKIEELETYKKNKINYLKLIGYEDGYMQAKITVPDIRDSVSNVFSNDSWIEIDKFSLQNCRFGILGKELNAEVGSLHISGITETKKGQLAFATNTLDKSLIFDATLFTNSLSNLVPRKNATFHISAGILQIHAKGMSKSGNNFSFSTDSEMRCRLPEIRRFLNTMHLLNTTVQPIQIELRFWDTPLHVRTKPPKVKHTDYQLDIDLLNRMCKQFHGYIDTDLVSLSLDDIDIQEEYWLTALNVIELDLENNCIAVKCPDKERNIHKRACYLMPIIFPFGDKFVLTIVTFISELLVPMKQGYLLKEPQRRISGCYLLDNFDNETKALVTAEINKFIKIYRDDNFFIFKDHPSFSAIDIKI